MHKFVAAHGYTRHPPTVQHGYRHPAALPCQNDVMPSDLRRPIERPRTRYCITLVGSERVNCLHPHGVVNSRSQIREVRATIGALSPRAGDPVDSESLSRGKRRREAISTMPHGAIDIKEVLEPILP